MSRRRAAAPATRRVSVADVVHDRLRSQILRGEIVPGTLLPAEIELAATAGVNRQAVREALQRLRQVGLVDIAHGGGSRVLDWRVNGSLSLLGEAMFSSAGPLDARVTESIFRLRLVTLVDAARLAALRRSDEVVAALRDLVEDMRAADADDAVLRNSFWRTVTIASGNVAYRLVVNTQAQLATRLPASVIESLLQGAHITDIYDALAAAVDSSDADAAARSAAAILSPAVDTFAAMAGPAASEYPTVNPRATEPALRRGSPMMLQPIGRHSVGDAVYEQLRDLIVSDIQPAGSTLPSERDLAASAGVNRQALREALQRLRALGLVDIVHGGGVRIRDWREAADLSLLPEIVVDAHGKIRPEPALSLVRFRITVNCDAAREAARLQMPGLAASLDAAMADAWALHEGSREVPTLSVIDAYERVWSAIIARSGNVAYQLVSNSLRTTARAYVGLFPPVRVPNPVPTQRYQETVDAVKAGDPESAAEAAATTLASAVKIFETYTAPTS